MKKRFFMGLLWLTGFQAHAFDCYLTIVKDSCWKDYTVTVVANDANHDDQLVEIIVPQGQSFAREKFSCKVGQTLSLNAKFSPEFWLGDEKKTFPALRYWKLPDNIESGISGWNVTVCFPKWFANVPMPPKTSSNCKCDTDHIPTLPPVKVVN